MKLEGKIQFNKRQRLGIIILIILIVVVQGLYFVIDFKKEITYDSTKYERIRHITDSLRQQALLPKKDTIYPFNPNYITDFKGYTLGMTTEEIDRLLAFRQEGKFVNSAEEFQQITRISDSLLAVISPSFRFPEWVKSQKNKSFAEAKNYPQKPSTVIVKQDINQATKEDLMKIRGIGQALSQRILEQKARLQGFSDMQQLSDVYGLDGGVLFLLNDYFEVTTPPKIAKKDINQINRYDLAKIPYLNYELAQEIIILRSDAGNISTFDELLKIEKLDETKIKWLQLYLYIEK
ncbi:MAG: helix-hairpin-helix domain-containing protein [Capnocytophaga sp.]|nr:helix-hairpin-helix domain-containing protein [Capnocytophaga sp.]